MAGRDEAEALIADWASNHLQLTAELTRCGNLIDGPVAITESFPSVVLYTYPENPRAYNGVTRSAIRQFLSLSLPATKLTSTTKWSRQLIFSYRTNLRPLQRHSCDRRGSAAGFYPWANGPKSRLPCQISEWEGPGIGNRGIRGSFKRKQCHRRIPLNA